VERRRINSYRECHCACDAEATTDLERTLH
jgi:hypothetical protein